MADPKNRETQAVRMTPQWDKLVADIHRFLPPSFEMRQALIASAQDAVEAEITRALEEEKLRARRRRYR